MTNKIAIAGVKRLIKALGLFLLLCACVGVKAGNGKLLETAGVTQVEGSAGGGLVPWAVIGGYGTKEQWSGQAFIAKLSLDDYRLQAYGIGVSLFDRVELTLAEQVFDLRSVPFGEREIRQQVYGIKYKVLGDFIYTPWPQVSIGVQHKSLEHELIPTALGAEDTNNGTDYYVAVSRAHLGVLGGYNGFWNLTLRATRANQFGLLGFGGDKEDSYQLMPELSAGVLLSRSVAVGMEYRQKPDNLSAVKEQHAVDVFVAYLPSKSLNMTAAWVDLGDIAGAENQQGLYLSMTGYLW